MDLWSFGKIEKGREVAIIALCQISTMKTPRNPAKNDPNFRL